MIAGMGFDLVLDQAEVMLVAQHHIQRTAREGIAEPGLDVVLAQPLIEAMHVAEAQKLVEDGSHCSCFSFVDGQSSIMCHVAKRNFAPHPHTFLLRGSNLVADTFSGNFALELRKGEKHVQRKPSHRRRCIELLRDRDEANAELIELLDQLGKVGQ